MMHHQKSDLLVAFYFVYTYQRPHVHVDTSINVNVWTCFHINVTTCINVYVYTRIR